MNILLFVACHLALSLAAPQKPASVYGPPNTSGNEFLSAPAPGPVSAPAPVSPVYYPTPSFAPAPTAVHYPAPALRYPVSAPAPAPVQYPVSAPAQYPVSAPAPAPAPLQYPAPAPTPYNFPAPAPHNNYNVPTPTDTTGGELLSAPAPAPVSQGGLPEEIVLPQNTRIEIRDSKGQYSHGFSDNKGTQISEQGSLITTNGGWEYVIAKKGSYSYVSPEGKKVSVSYIADHNGYRILDQKVE